MAILVGLGRFITLGNWSFCKAPVVLAAGGSEGVFLDSSSLVRLER